MSDRPDESASQIFAERTWLQGATLSSIAYGAEGMLYAMCLYLLIRQRNVSNTKKIYSLIAYITLIFILGTLFMVSCAAFNEFSFVDHRNWPGGPAAYEEDNFYIPIDSLGNVAYMLSNWSAEGLMLWRFMVIYRSCRLPLWSIMLFPGLLFTASFTMGILWLIQLSANSPWASSSINWTIPFFSLSLALEFIVTIAIAIRLYVFRRRITSLLGTGHGSQYTSIAAMVVESAAISSSFSLLFLIPFAVNSPVANLFLQSLGQVQIIATLLIVFRVAQGSGWSAGTTTALFSTVPESKSKSMRMQGLSGIRFAQADASETIVDRVASVKSAPMNRGIISCDGESDYAAGNDEGIAVCKVVEKEEV